MPSRQWRRRFQQWQRKINWQKRIYITIAEQCAKFAKER